jgi:hypothetical protein
MARSSRWLSRGFAVVLIAVGAGCLPSSEDNAAADRTSKVDVPKLEPKQASDGKDVKPTDPVRMRIEAALASVRQRDLLTTNSFWTIFHGILGMGPDTMLKNPETGKRHNALDYIFSETGGQVRGLSFIPTDVGLDVTTVGKDPFLKEHEGQGHQDQFVAEMIQWGVEPTRPIRIAAFPNKTYRFSDFVAESKARARLDQDQELGWCLIVVADHGGGTEAEWVNRAGQKIKFEDMLEYEMKLDINMAACGGTHRLFGIAWAYHRHVRHCKETGKAMSPTWKKAKEYLDKYKNLSKEWQAPNGEFSTGHYREKEHIPELEPRIAASGHILEWLAQYATEEDLRSEWMENGARAVAQVILESDRLPVASGGLYHAAHGLATYHERRYGLKLPTGKAAAVHRQPKQ